MIKGVYTDSTVRIKYTGIKSATHTHTQTECDTLQTTFTISVNLKPEFNSPIQEDPKMMLCDIFRDLFHFEAKTRT